MKFIMKISGKFGLTFLFVVLFANVLFAQKFTAVASKTEVAVGEGFEVTFSVNANGDQFTPPSLGGFEVISGPNSSSSMMSVNGNTTVTIGYSFDLVSQKEGTFTIGSASIVVNGKRLISSPIKIKVVKGSPQSAQRQQQGQQGGGGRQPRQGGGQQQQQPVMATPEEARDLSKSLFIRADINRDRVYQGEEVTLTYKLYTRIAIDANQLDKMPDFTGFWNQDIKPTTNEAQWKVELYNGQRYNVAEVKQIILFPDHSGDITIDPMLMTFAVRQPVASNDPFDQFFGAQSYKEIKFQAKSNKVVIHSRPLPNQPAGFTGAVGKYNVTATVDKKELKANESLNYKVTVTGVGNIKLLKSPTITFPTDFETYDPKVTDSVTVNETGVSGYKVYNYLLIPRHQGNYDIDPLKFSYFNPVTNKYQSVTAPGFKIKVNKGDKEVNVTTLPTDQLDKKLGTDIHDIKTGFAGLDKNENGFFGSVLFYVLLLLGPLGVIGAAIYRKWYRRYNADVVKVKSRKASKLAAKHLAVAKKQLQAKNSKAFYEAVFRGLYGYLSDKLNIPVADLDKENIAENLKNRNVKEQTIGRLIETLDLCEMARYAPVTAVSEQGMFEKAKEVINDIEDEI